MEQGLKINVGATIFILFEVVVNSDMKNNIENVSIINFCNISAHSSSVHPECMKKLKRNQLPH